MLHGSQPPSLPNFSFPLTSRDVDWVVLFPPCFLPTQKQQLLNSERCEWGEQFGRGERRRKTDAADPWLPEERHSGTLSSSGG